MGENSTVEHICSVMVCVEVCNGTLYMSLCITMLLQVCKDHSGDQRRVLAFKHNSEGRRGSCRTVQLKLQTLQMCSVCN